MDTFVGAFHVFGGMVNATDSFQASKIEHMQSNKRT